MTSLKSEKLFYFKPKGLDENMNCQVKGQPDILAGGPRFKS